VSLFGGFGPEVSRLCLCGSLPARSACGRNFDVIADVTPMVRVRIGVIARTARYIGRVGFVEDPHLQKPQRHLRQAHADAVAAALRSPAPQGGERADHSSTGYLASSFG
jgi:hypothetical protein